jgi:hypothetical protein
LEKKVIDLTYSPYIGMEIIKRYIYTAIDSNNSKKGIALFIKRSSSIIIVQNGPSTLNAAS